MTRAGSFLTLAFCLLPFALGSGVAQNAPPPQFRAAVDLVQVDVSVLDRARLPVSGLSAADFSILENGKPQKIAAFNQIDLPNPETLPVAWMRDVAPDVRRNDDVDERRLVVLVMDDAMLPFDVQMITSAKQIGRDVVDRLGPADLAAVVFTRDNRRAQNFTQDRARLIAAVDSIVSAGHDPVNPTFSDLPLILSTIDTLARAASYLGTIPKRRKAIIYVSVGVPLDLDQLMNPASPMHDIFLRARTMFREAQAANVNIYSIDPSGLDGIRFYIERRVRADAANDFSDRPNLYRDFLQTVSETSGGHAFINSNEFTSQVTQILRETGSFYLLGYQPANPAADGKFRRIDVKVNRPGLTVRSRRGYYAPDPPGTARVVPPTIQAIAGLLPVSDLPLQVVAAPFALDERREAAVAIVLGVRPSPGSFASRSSDPVDVLMNAYTYDGDARGSLPLKATVALRPGSTRQVAYEVLGRMELAPGRYELRLAADSAALGLKGSVYCEVDVPDFSKGAVSLSGVVLSAPTAAPAAGGVDSLASLLPVVPTSLREFAAADRVLAFLRVYQGGDRPLASVVLKARIVDSRNAAALEKTETLGPSRFDSARAVDFALDLPTSTLAAGAYLLTIEATAGNTTARRDVRFSVK